MQCNRIFYISLSLLLSIPAYSMQPAQQRLQQKVSQQFIKCTVVREFLIQKGITRGAPLLGMQPIVVDLAKEPTTTTNIITGAAAFGTLGGVVLSFAAPPVVVAAGAGAIFLFCWNAGNRSAAYHDNSTFHAPDTTTTTTTTTSAIFAPSYNANEDIVDPKTQFMVRAGTARHKELLEEMTKTQYGFTDEKVTIPAQVHASVLQKVNGKKLSKEKIAKKASKEALKGDGGNNPKKPEDEKNKERKINPPDFKQKFKKHPRTKSNYKTHDDGSLRLKDHANEPFKTNDGKIVDKIKCDHYHNDLEVYDKMGEHLGSMDPVTHEIYKAPVRYRGFAVVPPVVAQFFVNDVEAKDDNNWVEQSPIAMFDRERSENVCPIDEPKMERLEIDPRFAYHVESTKVEEAPVAPTVTRTPSRFAWDGEEVHIDMTGINTDIDWSGYNHDVGDFSGADFSWADGGE